MSLFAVETLASAPATSTPAAYNSAYWTLPNDPSIMRQRTDVSPAFIGPMTNAISRPIETVGALPPMTPRPISWSKDIDWVFCGDYEGNTNYSRKITLYTLNKTNSTLNYIGYVNFSIPYRSAANNPTMQALDITYQTYATGSVAVTGANVTGSVASWVTSRLAAGSRIGFGSTSPSAIAQGNWYNILSIVNNNILTLTTSASVPLASGSAYVIEDLRAVWTQQYGVAANGAGVFVAKGLSYNDFFPVVGASFYWNGTTTTTTDNQRNVYWLSDGVTQTDTLPLGQGLAPMDDWTQQYLYVLNIPGGTAGTTYNISKYNIRAALTSNFSSGSTAGCYNDGDAFVLRTATMNINPQGVGTFTSGICCLATAKHGPAANQRALYFPTHFATGNNNILHCCKDADIFAGSTCWNSAEMLLNPPSNSNTFPTSDLTHPNFMWYDSVIDRFCITMAVVAGTWSIRQFITQFSQNSLDHIFLADTRLYNQFKGDVADTAIYPNVLESYWGHGAALNGVHYYLRLDTTAVYAALFAYPMGADWQYAIATGNILISPALNTPLCNNYNTFYIIRDRIIGTDNLGQISGGIKTYYRTAGISNNTGTWLPLPDGNDLTAVPPAPQIQFAYAFQMISPIPLPARIYRIGVTYTPLVTDSHYQPSVGNSSTVTTTFAWRFASAFGSAVPTLRVRFYCAITNSLLVDDSTASPAGTWQKTTNGITWGAYNTNDLASGNSTTYIRYTPVGLPAGSTVRVLLTLQ